MLILDYLKFIENNELHIAPFHTGHLGLFPGTEVSVGLLHKGSREPSPCELLITPFSEDSAHLCRLRVTMNDEEGAVRRLLDAVASLGLNIVTLESSVMNFQVEHHVVMVLDWQRSPHNAKRETPRRLRNLYRRNAYRIPTHDWRYVLLYEAIMYECGDIVLMDKAHGFPLPSISIIPFTPAQSFGATRINVHENKTLSPPKKGRTAARSRAGRTLAKMTNSLTIPDVQVAEIRRETGFSDDSPLPAVMYSSPNDKGLRVFVPTDSMLRGIVHIGFAHVNKPGALSAITRLLEDAKFNILTSILRKQTANDSTFEVLLQYTEDDPDDQPPDWLHQLVSKRKYPEMVNWVFERIARFGEHRNSMSEYKVALCAPKYPKPFVDIPDRPLADDMLTEVCPEKAATRTDVVDRFEQHKQTISKTIAGLTIGDLQRQQIRFVSDVLRRVRQEYPRVFLSHPHTAANHAKIIADALQPHKRDDFNGGPSFEVVVYQEADYEDIIKQVKEKIENCDYFIGIWHHERHQGATETTVSPWMPFEYGIAVARDKSAMITYSEQLPEEIWKRIDPGTAKEAYNDLSFEKRTVKKIVDRALEDWFPDWSHRWPRLQDVMEFNAR